jgi:hypothetical protein
MVHKKNWLIIPVLLVGLGLTVMGCSQSDNTSGSTSRGMQPAEAAKPSTDAASGQNASRPPASPPSPSAAAPSPSPAPPSPGSSGG